MCMLLGTVFMYQKYEILYHMGAPDSDFYYLAGYGIQYTRYFSVQDSVLLFIKCAWLLYCDHF